MRRLATLILVLTALGATADLALGQDRRAIPFKATVHSTIVYETAKGVSVEVGRMRSSRLVRGAVIIRFGGSADEEEQQARMTIFTSRGTIRARTHITRKTQPDGSVKGTGRGRIVGGSHAYRGARGSFSIDQTVTFSEDEGPPPGVDPGTEPPEGEGGAPSGASTKFTMEGRILVRD